MGLFMGIDASASGLTAERLRMDVISNNIANSNTTRTDRGGAYRRRFVVFEPRTREPKSFEKALQQAVGLSRQTGEGVRAVSIMEDTTQGPMVYDPSHPDANAEGYVEKPNVNIVNEMVDMITAQRAYEANSTAITAAKTMITKTLEIGR
ncbi:MAG: flagellar basal body rod protein FlgC [Selenomonadaceae bacterium]|nr:flagellar basal body rod protein FlgC [Selenomonadaceae bacterium]MBQ6758651.1 flagellar basal body rod protein FlgC [Selenomonadaceae bacterium]MBQ6759293.1 flagellar basal body rod protein FlgC [Selenomonadaceae bacterium]MBR0102291.1 flagellar basal body rod protein FlgC [Selenomonadaceae bacterium]MBR6712953.1 flagellar basal body rod protein FlgC [Selenomonadaceae bacterium]